MTAAPSYPHDLFTDQVLSDPYEHYRALRGRGPVVWLDAHQMYAVARYAEARAVLGDPGTYCSGRGVALNDTANALAAGRNVLMTDGKLHEHLRRVLARNLTPRALRAVEDGIGQAASKLVATLVTRGSFDAVTDLATALPLTVVPDLVGWPAEAREHLLEWAAATFDLLGPLNDRAQRAAPLSRAMMAFAAETAATGNLLPGSVGAFSRVTTVTARAGDVDIPAGARVVVLYASANRDERHFTHPDEFDITRPNAGEHLGFGWGVHGCAGQGLARMEAHALLTALAEQVDRIDLTAPATAVLNNLINARASVPVTVTPARTTGTGPSCGPSYAGAGG